MSDFWYHATPQGGRLGPMRAEDLARLFETGGVQGTTPVWRDGMTGWVPLSSVANELGLSAMPPPLPRAPQPPPRRGLHWVWIVVIVLAGLAVPVLAVLAAIALPAYNDYRLRAGIAEVALASTSLRLAVQGAAVDGQRCPIVSGSAGRAVFSNPDVDAAVAGLLAHPRVADVMTLNRSALDQCEILVKLQDFEHAAIDGNVLNWSLEPGTGAWSCGSSVARRFLPEHCRRQLRPVDGSPHLRPGDSGK